MRILDENNIVLETYDSNKGYVKEEAIIIAHHNAVEEVEEKGHYEVIKEYDNGGKDVKWVVDVEGVEPKEAYDEYETILRYIPYSKKELAVKEIDSIKTELCNDDYKIIKCMEAYLVNDELPYDIISLHKNREVLRNAINALELELETLS